MNTNTGHREMPHQIVNIQVYIYIYRFMPLDVILLL